MPNFRGFFFFLQENHHIYVHWYCFDSSHSLHMCCQLMQIFVLGCSPFWLHHKIHEIKALAFFLSFIFGTFKVYYHNILLWCQRLQWWSGGKHTNTPLCLNMVSRLEIDGSQLLSFHCVLLVLPNALASIQCIFMDIVRIVPMLLLTTK